MSLVERDYPSEEQLFKLYILLTFFKNGKIYWHQVMMRGSAIAIKTEPPKGEIDLRVFYIYQNGEVDEDGFRD